MYTFVSGDGIPPANPAIHFRTFFPTHFTILAIPGPARSVVMYMFRLAGHYGSSGMARRRDWISPSFRSMGNQRVLFRVVVVDVDFQAHFGVGRDFRSSSHYGGGGAAVKI